MAKNTSITLGDHFDGFCSAQVGAGRYSNVSEVVRAGLRLLEEHEQKFEALRRALEEGATSGDAGPLDFAEIRRVAREQAGLPSGNAQGARPRPRRANRPGRHLDLLVRDLGRSPS